MQTQITAGRVFDFSHTVGRSAASGTGFRVSVAAATGALATHVVHRGYERVPNVGWHRDPVGA